MSEPSQQTTPQPVPPVEDVASLSYEQAREQLVNTAQRLEAGNLTLEESLSLWERGEALADRCQAWLDGARDRLESAQAARRSSMDSPE
ncbi:exodeoxyribonuclease VII small subunit [Brevibacterium sp. 50QC2O2]|jgi:exodeoxyribonuclease VII small subunit|uniref:exodeoxyribonuclease VII small subunit n=1 Tax=Brevibacterium TaxID=1696 RepID=UPI00211C4D85|nr:MULTISPECIES: exodeoxyribonuclease VII small subunit [unclassified Brevibacterium]MCQ9368520.1 exodeoxyribonuclease VII small subunit [Brevibacterium sp. 91QC2O2]MCQ9385900.1 exodeoxyribonuclease VII small subunit [Brevibacterium sp. 68QC2CO]MCQ9387434.1 exodeoxyribonuclease VII small subunit [Brevibacterium sp. 50QC2O2]